MKLLVALALVLLSGCATAEKYDENMRAWVGQNVNQLVAQNGVPTKTMDMPNGDKVYEYHYIGNTVVQAHAVRNMAFASSNTPTCTTSFVSDSLGTIKSYAWRGNCTAE
jgi:uncharacterized lipoprotein YajG